MENKDICTAFIHYKDGWLLIASREIPYLSFKIWDSRQAEKNGNGFLRFNIILESTESKCPTFKLNDANIYKCIQSWTEEILLDLCNWRNLLNSRVNPSVYIPHWNHLIWANQLPNCLKVYQEITNMQIRLQGRSTFFQSWIFFYFWWNGHISKFPIITWFVIQMASFSLFSIVYWLCSKYNWYLHAWNETNHVVCMKRLSSDLGNEYWSEKCASI